MSGPSSPGRAMGHFVVAVVVAAAAGSAIFLIMVQGSFHKGYTDLDFGHVLGTAVKGTTLRDTQAREALGLVGDQAGPIGLYATLIGAAVLVTVYGLVTRRVHRNWVVTGLGLGVVTFLVIGLAFGPVADVRQDEYPTGLFGVDAGGFTAVVLLISALGFGVVAARCYDLIMSDEWWEPREAEGDEVAAITGVEEDGSLELPEEGSEEGRVRA